MRYEIKMLWFLVESKGTEGDQQLYPTPQQAPRTRCRFDDQTDQGQKRGWRRQGGGRCRHLLCHLHSLLRGWRISQPLSQERLLPSHGYSILLSCGSILLCLSPFWRSPGLWKPPGSRPSPPFLRLCPTSPEPSLQPPPLPAGGSDLSGGAAPFARAGVASQGRSPLPACLHPPPDTLIRQLSLLPCSLCKSQHEQVAADGRRHLGINGAICHFFPPSV